MHVQISNFSIKGLRAGKPSGLRLDVKDETNCDEAAKVKESNVIKK